GALAINRIMLKSLMMLKQKPYQIIWATGTFYFDKVQEKIKNVDIGNNIKVLPYIKNMPGLLPEMTCVVSRSGPSPNVTHNHQMKNALDLEKAGAALVIPEDDLNPNNFVSSIDHILLDEKYATEMSKASKALGVPDASDQVIKVMEEISR
ncbi:MAG: UDP-N-acetylglucosamine--N-acetylmuramyl-(pentapeptide) pyrophosphoryl-undecaprenol N-acetylglucosamine transferase, partial [Lactobacillus crispatus]|nr:UDP-N-acetylglucosamine--N-acetylmuramyl-(pentapeptide) pyrophosphoryl-undecaprenol N-acetylglucosamine transferase [Lactobacillus crispatus]MCT7879678.1 UDP-N-acetylglucosamine--N-acetylmuramyl-(pentapeptide) pyrophosphoryl-undecaprenol N-acetylglucosamine transferase [Lactobacillus crispatus]